MTTTAEWIAGARPRTLWTAVTPVAVGSAAAASLNGFDPLAAVVALSVALAMQIGVNYANDYSDGIRGTDVDRIGPERLVASGRATPSAVRTAALTAFAVGAILGLYLVVLSGIYWLLVIGALALVAAWTYTGSSRPYGYAGGGEISVLVFYGPVATLGTMVTQAGQVTWWAGVASAGVGLSAVGLIMVNNIRDLDSDAHAGKRTLAVRMGPFRSRQVFAAVVLAPVLLAVVVAFARPWALLATVVALPSLLIALGMRLGVRGAPMKVVFSGLSAVGLTYGLLLALGIWL